MTADQVRPPIRDAFKCLFRTVGATWSQLWFQTSPTTPLEIARIGLGLIIPALSLHGLRTLSPAMLAYGAGTMNFMRQLGGAGSDSARQETIDQFQSSTCSRTSAPRRVAFPGRRAS